MVLQAASWQDEDIAQVILAKKKFTLTDALVLIMTSTEVFRPRTTAVQKSASLCRKGHPLFLQRNHVAAAGVWVAISIFRPYTRVATKKALQA